MALYMLLMVFRACEIVSYGASHVADGVIEHVEMKTMEYHMLFTYWCREEKLLTC